ncbi:MAG: zinc ABC transporter substrate-binding protein [Microthrixaceae bacterium]
MNLRSFRLVPTLVGVALLGPACGGSEDATSPSGDCPVDAVEVVATVNQWGDITQQLGGDCASVTTVITGTGADPHDFEPTPGDLVAFEEADLVVRNGLGYDEWATRATDTARAEPAVVDVGLLVGAEAGDNPHLWYSPEAVTDAGEAITRQLSEAAPGAEAYLADRATEFQQALAPYEAQLERIRREEAGASVAATEPVAEPLIEAAGLVELTPDGYRNAAAGESEPAPGDLAEFRQLIDSGEISALIVNTQSSGSAAEQLRSLAEDRNIPIVEVTETIPEDVDGFVDWQVGQLRRLAEALDS